MRKEFARLVSTTDKSMSTLSRESGVALSHISRIQSGKSLPTLTVISKLARVLETDVESVVRSLEVA